MAVMALSGWFALCWLFILPLSTGFQPFRTTRTFSGSRFGSRACLQSQSDPQDSAAAGSPLDVHLLALSYSPREFERAHPIGFYLWRWKNYVFGDNPNPETATKFNQLIVDHVPGVEACSTIPTCARFEILLVVNRTEAEFSSVLERISSLVVSQSQSDFRSEEDLDFTARHGLLGQITESAVESDDEDAVQFTVNRMWYHAKGVEKVCRHMCLVTTAVDPKPQSTIQPSSTAFRPFDSQQAVVLRQFRQVANITKGNRLKILLDASLRAGKMARDPDAIPEIIPLREKTPPKGTPRNATQAVRRVAIQPIVDACVKKIRGMDLSGTIVSFRTSAEQLGQDPVELRWIRQQIHAPTEDLRKGKDVDTARLLKDIESVLEEQRGVALAANGVRATLARRTKEVGREL